MCSIFLQAMSEALAIVQSVSDSSVIAEDVEGGAGKVRYDSWVWAPIISRLQSVWIELYYNSNKTNQSECAVGGRLGSHCPDKSLPAFP
jgi:hypothetical protein